LYRAIFIVSFFGLLRIGEITLTPTGSTNVIQSNNLTLHRSKSNRKINKATIYMPKYKHFDGKTSTIILKKNSDVIICPVNALKSYLKRRSARPGQLFICKNDRTLFSSTFRSLLRSCVEHIGLDPTNIHLTHSE
jgi:hypothetical protein